MSAKQSSRPPVAGRPRPYGWRPRRAQEKDAALRGDGRRARGPGGRGSSRPTPSTSPAAREAGTAEGIVDRLTLTADRLAAIADALRAVADLPDPVGEVVRGYTLPNGLQVRQVRVPLGVVGMIYEARPNVTVDAAGLGLKSGNAVLLRGSSSAYDSNTALVGVMQDALAAAGLPRGRGPARARHVPRGGQAPDDRPRPGRRAHPARRRRPDPVGGRGVDGPGHRDRGGQLPRLRRRRRRSRQGRPRSSSTPRRSGSASATRPRPCWCTPTSRDAFLPMALAALRGAGVTVHGDARIQAARLRRPCRPSCR